MTQFKFNEDGWTDWIDHGGDGCPCVGWYCQAELDKKLKNGGAKGMYKVIGPKKVEGLAKISHHRAWSRVPGYTHFIRYRVRKPKGAKMLEQLAQNTDIPIKEMV